MRTRPNQYTSNWRVIFGVYTEWLGWVGDIPFNSGGGCKLSGHGSVYEIAKETISDTAVVG